MGKRLALIVGNSVYQDQTLARLKAPEADIGALHEVLKDPEVGGFEDVDLLINSKTATIRRAISEFFSRKGRNDLLLLYFSGHGVLDDRGRLYLAVKDTDHSLLRGTAVAASFISDEMDNSRSQRQVLILDCCHSGAFARGTKGSAGLSVGTASAFEGTGFGRVVLTATDATQYAWEGERIIGETENSLFTHYMVEGLQSGEADMNGDGQITIDELYDYVYAQVIQQTPSQTPGKWSFKEQGEIVIAKAGRREEAQRIVEVPAYLDAEQQQKLEQLYTKGLSAYWLEEWEQAAYNFQTILEIDPDYQDAAKKFDEVRRQIKLKKTYVLARAALEERKYNEAISAFEALVVEAPDYKDAAAKLQFARKQATLTDLYAQAKQLHRAQQWQAVINIFDKIAELTPDYMDADELLPSTKQAFERQKHLAEIQRRYQRALRAMNSGKWQEARNIFSRIQEEEPGYEDTTRLLAKVEAETSRQERQRQVQKQVGMLYEQAVSLTRTGQWRQALEKLNEIGTLEAEFDDPEGIATRAKAELLKEEQEAQRQNELASLYAEAVRLLRAEQYAEALEKWDEVQAIKPDYMDRYKVQKSAKRKLAAQAKPGPGSRQLSIRKYVLPGLLGLAMVVMAIVLASSSGIFTNQSPAGTMGAVILVNTTHTPESTSIKTEGADLAKITFTYERSFGETGVPYIADTTHLYGPGGVGIDISGNLLVAETLGSRILKYSGNGKFLGAIGNPGKAWLADNKHVSQPQDAAADSDGNIWVVDQNSHRVVKYDPLRNYLTQLGMTGEEGSDNAHFAKPMGVTFDSAGNIYVSDTGNQRIQVFNSEGTYQTTIGESGVSGSDNNHFNSPLRMAIDEDDNLYAADMGNERVQIFDGNHNYVATLGVTGEPGDDNNHFSSPSGVAVDASRIFVADEANHKIKIFDRATRSYKNFLGGLGSDDYQFKSPRDVAVDPYGNIYVADSLNSRVQKFDSNLAYVGTIGITGVPYVTDGYHYNQPVDIAVDDVGNITILEDWGRGERLVKLNPDGDPLFTIGEAGVGGSDNNHFDEPRGVAFGAHNNIYVADCNNHRIQIFSSEGMWSATLGTGFGTGDYQFNCPSGVAFDSMGNVYVADAKNHRVQIYDSNRIYKATLGVSTQAGSDNNHFNLPSDIDVDASGNIYVADTYNNRVQVFDSHRNWQKTLGVTGMCGHDNDHFCEPLGVALDPVGNLYVAEMYNPRVQVFNSSGAYLTTIGEVVGSQNEQFRQFHGVDVDTEGNVYIADRLNHRIEKYSPDKTLSNPTPK